MNATPEVTPIYSAARRYSVLVASGMATFLTTTTTSMVNVALPTMAEDFQVDITTVQWVALVFFLVIAATHLTAGRYGDIYGRRHTFLGGILVFGVASLACGFAPTLGWLIVARVVVAVGAAFLQSQGQALLVAVFSPRQRSRAIGLFFTLASAGLALGPVLAALSIEFADWRWMFFALVPLSAITLVIAFFSAPHIQGTGEKNFDWLSSVLLIGWVAPLIYAINRGFSIGFQFEVLVALATFVVLAIAFAMRTASAANPLLDIRIFKNIDFSIGMVVGLTGFVCMSSVMLNGPFVLERVMGIPVLQAGLYMAIYPVMSALLAPLIGVISDQIGPGLPRTIGFYLASIAYLSMAFLSPDSPVILAVATLALVGISVGMTQTPNNSIIMGAVPRSQLGTAGAFISSSRTFGFGAGQSIWGGLFAFVVLLSFDGGRAIDAPVEQQSDSFALVFVLAGALVFVAAQFSLWQLVTGRGAAAALAGPAD